MPSGNFLAVDTSYAPRDNAAIVFIGCIWIEPQGGGWGGGGEPEDSHHSSKNMEGHVDLSGVATAVTLIFLRGTPDSCVNRLCFTFVKRCMTFGSDAIWQFFGC